MFIYLILIAFWGLTAFVINSINNPQIKQTNKLYILIAGVSLFFVMSLRNISVGTDTVRYSNEFKNAKYYLDYLIRESEIGYSYFNYFLNEIGLSFQTYLAIVAIIVISAISFLYYLYSKNVLLSFYLHVTIGLFAMTMTGLRQTIAISLTVYAFIFLMKNKNILFFIFVISAYFFHNSAIVFLLVFFIKRIKVNKITGIWIYGICCLVYVGKGFIASVIQEVMPLKYLRYSTDVAYVNPLLIIVVMIIPLACLLFWPKEIEVGTNKQKNIMSVLFLLSCINFVIYFFALEIMLFERISLFFMVYNTVLIPNIIQGIKSKEIRILAKIACFVFPILQFIISTPGGSMGIDNYKFFWE